MLGTGELSLQCWQAFPQCTRSPPHDPGWRRHGGAECRERFTVCSPWGRFGTVEDNAGLLRLYTVQVPHKRERRPPPCYLTKWDGKSFLPLLTRPCGSEVISCLSIRYPGARQVWD